MIDSIPNALQNIHPPAPGNDLQYIVYAIAVTITVIWLGSVFITQKYGKSQAPQTVQKPTEDAVEQARRQIGVKAVDSELASLLNLHFKSLAELLNEKIESVKTSTNLEFKMLKQTVDTNHKVGEERQTRLEKTVSDGFRSVNKRIDKHLEAQHTTDEEKIDVR